MDFRKNMRELIDELNIAAAAYYNAGETIMSDKEYDAKFDVLKELEERTGIIFPDSPTQRVGSEVTKEKKKVKHEFPALSLGKTKSRDDLEKWLGGRKGILSWKMDGQTVQLTYENGKLVLAATRGNGEIGEDITCLAPYIAGIPVSIPLKGKFVVRGESVMSYEEFKRINEQIEDEAERYKNPRNLAVGTLNKHDVQVLQERQLNFFAFQAVYPASAMPGRFGARLDYLEELGFHTVPHWEVYSGNNPEGWPALDEIITNAEAEVVGFPFPTDGLVLAYDDAVYGESLGTTGHHPRHSIAFKWADETAETTLLDVEWSPSKTGLLNPVTIFEPVELEGTTVSRASIHNVSIFRKLMLGKGDLITVYKANMIIPQVETNLTGSNSLDVPAKCPVCGQGTRINVNKSYNGEDIETLYCYNPDCPCKMLGKLEHFVSRDAMDIDGVSGKTIEALNAHGWLNNFSDFYRLKDYEDEMKKVEGMGETSVSNILASVERSRRTTLSRFLYALSIPQVGKDTARLIADFCDNDKDRFVDEILPVPEILSNITGIGPVVVSSLAAWYANLKNQRQFFTLLEWLYFEKPERQGNRLAGLTFVVTGSVSHFANRDALHAFIHENGGKTAGSVSRNTSYLINNDTMSTSGKNKKARDLGIPVINEEQFLSLVQ